MTDPGQPSHHEQGGGAGQSPTPGGPGPGEPRLPPGGRPAGGTVWYSLVHRAEHAAVRGVESVAWPAWRRRTPGEHRWPATVSIIAAIVLQTLLPHQLALLPRYLLPALEVALLAGLVVANPVRIERRSRAVRVASIVLIFLITVANAVSAGLLIRDILTGTAGASAVPLLASGASVWATNVIAFALWYWEFDRGGPVHRAHGTIQYPDLMFPQMASPELAAPGWEPQFADYLYLAFTNATAFSPTDVMPLSRWAKLAMLVQSAVSLALAVVVVARAVNILKT